MVTAVDKTADLHRFLFDTLNSVTNYPNDGQDLGTGNVVPGVGLSETV